MYLSELKIWNFRKYGLKEEQAITNDNPCLCMHFEQGLNVIVGQNDSGKTAIIDAIRYTLDTNSSDRFFITEEDFYANKTNLRIGLTFLFDKNEDPINLCASFIEHLSYSENKPILHITLVAQLTERKNRGNRFIDRKIKTGINGSGNVLEGELREFIKSTYLRPLRDAQTALSAGRSSRLSQILSGHELIKDGRDNLIKHLIEANQKIKNEAAISNTEKSINSNYLEHMVFADDALKANINISEYTSFKTLKDHQKDYMLKKLLEKLNLDLIETGKEFQTIHGLGYNNLMFIATELLLIEQDKSSNISLLLIEEPEAHLHPQMQLQLLEFIKSKSEIQTIITTHSPNLASKVPVEKIHLLAGEMSFPLKKNYTKLDDDDYEFLDKFLDVTKSNLFFAHGVLIVEGDSENILMPTIAKLLNVPLEKHGISIVKVGHTGLFRFSKIFQRSNDRQPLIPIKISCLTDRDLRPTCVRYCTEDIDGNKDNSFGYIKQNSRNKKLFDDYYDNSPERVLSDYINKKKIHDGQNVKTFVSPYWTLEYDLIMSGLSKQMYKAIMGNDVGYFEFDNTDINIYASKIYKPLVTNSSKSKTETAYKFSKILLEEYWDNSEQKAKNTSDLISKLPKYLIYSLEHVTGKKIFSKEIIEQNNV